MLDFQQKRKVKSFIYNRVTIGIIFVLVLYSSYSTIRVYQKQRESQLLKDVATKKLLELEQRDREIDFRINDLDTKQGLEREIRGKFNVSKDDENMVVVLDKESSTTSNQNVKIGFWQKILAIFTNIW